MLVNAQDSSSSPGADSFTRKRVVIIRTELKPDIDGVLDDEIWKVASVISDLHQYSPVDQSNPSERSEFYIAYDENYFYLAARLYDSDPEGISARQLVQGGGFGSDDSFKFILDTFNNGRTGYQFEVNPNGIRREGVFENPNSLNRDWSGIWLVESAIDEQGWTAEVAIPFSTLNFNPDIEEWGFTVGRTIARKRENVAWSSFNRNMNPTTTGIISGIRGIRQGVGLDIIPSLNVSNSENYIDGTTESNFEPSLDIFYKFTPNLTGSLTINTDFSATEVDNQQINLSRFSLFFPEKRDFFIQDVDIFTFGGLSQNGIPFYSRRIGLSSTGEPVDLEAGFKMTGRVGRWNVGALVTQQAEFGAVDQQTVFVGRVSANVLSESNIGVIFTDGDPTSNSDNSLVGADFRYQNTRFTDTHTLRGNLWYQQSDTPGLHGDDKAYGIQANLNTQNNGFGGSVNYQRFGEDFNPALGFANRRGIESLEINLRGRYNVQDHKYIRTLNTFTRMGQTRNLITGRVESENIFWRFININTHIGDQGGLGIGQNREVLEEDFEIRPGIVIPVGDYRFANVNAEIQFSNQRRVSGNLRFNIGDYWNGKRSQIRGSIGWRPDEHLNLSMNYQYQDIELPGGSFRTRQIRINANYAFDSKWSWINLVQYDNGSKSVGLNSRLRWNPQAGEDMFLVVSYKFDSTGGAFDQLSADSSSIVLKYTKTFRF